MPLLRSRTKSTPGALRGLDANNILTPTPTQRPIKINGDSDTVSQPVVHRYGTRTAKHGRAANTYDKYDMKHHPADWKLRPAQAAKRRSGSGSASRSLSVSTLASDDENRNETSEESLPESARDEASEQDSDESAEDVSIVYNRKPDPGASRTSKRSEAKKFVNYNVKHHKDDHRIPGFQHKARQLKRAAADDPSGGNVKKKQRIVKSRESKSPPAPSYSQPSSDADDLVERTLAALENVTHSTARHSTKPNAQIVVESSNEENSSDDDLEEPDDGAFEEDPLPAFTTLHDSADEDFPKSQLGMLSHDIDEELLESTQVPTSDGAGAAKTSAPRAAIPVAHASSTGEVESREGSPDEVESEASTKPQESSTEVERNQEITSPSSHSGVSPAIGRKPSGTPDDTDIPCPTADSHDTVEASAQDMPKSTHFESNPNEALEDHSASAEERLEDGSQGHSEEILAGAEVPMAGIDKAQESEKTLEVDTSLGSTVSEEVRSASANAPEVLGSEQTTNPGETDHSGEAVELEATTLQAMLEYDIAAGEHTVANTLSSDIMI